MEMKARTFAHVSASAVACCLLFALPAAGQDKKAATTAEKKAAAPAAEKGAIPAGTTKTIVDDARFLVTEVTFKPGQGGAPRERPPRVVRALTDGTMERTYSDGKTEKVEWKAGQVRAFPKDTFGNRNIGKTDVVLYVVQPK